MLELKQETNLEQEEKMDLKELLSLIDFDFYIEDDKIKLKDLQGANLGNIEDEEWEIYPEVVSALIDRLEVYWQDYIIRDIFELLKESNLCKTEKINFDDNYLSLSNVLEKLDKDKFSFHIKILKILSHPETIEIR